MWDNEYLGLQVYFANIPQEELDDYIVVSSLLVDTSFRDHIITAEGLHAIQWAYCPGGLFNNRSKTGSQCHCTFMRPKKSISQSNPTPKEGPGIKE